jgi:hypothetical protein
MFGPFLCSGRIWTQGLTLSRQVLHHLSHTPSSCCIGYFWNRILLFLRPAWTVIFLFVLLCHSWHDRLTPTCPNAEAGFVNFVLQLVGLISDPPNLYLPSSYATVFEYIYQQERTCCHCVTQVFYGQKQTIAEDKLCQHVSRHCKHRMECVGRCQWV